jgi:hypothetical protein
MKRLLTIIFALLLASCQPFLSGTRYTPPPRGAYTVTAYDANGHPAQTWTTDAFHRTFLPPAVEFTDMSTGKKVRVDGSFDVTTTGK